MTNNIAGIGVGKTIVPGANPAGFILSSGMKIRDEASARAEMEGWTRQITKEIADRFKTKFQEQGWIN